MIVPGTPANGEKLFSERRCSTCHAVAGKGGRVGPDLGRSGHHVSLTQFAARMWDHGPTMWATMKKRVKWLLAAALIAYIMVPASIILMHDFGAWWGAMVPWFLVALLAGS